MVVPIVSYHLALAIGHRAGVRSLTQTFYTRNLPRRGGGDGPGGGALIRDGRMVAFEFRSRVTAVVALT